MQIICSSILFFFLSAILQLCSSSATSSVTTTTDNKLKQTRRTTPKDGGGAHSTPKSSSNQNHRTTTAIHNTNKKVKQKNKKASNPNNAPYVQTNDANTTPQIKGVSPTITPHLLSTIKSFKKYYTKSSKLQPLQLDAPREDEEGHKDNKHDILNRIQTQNDVQNNKNHAKVTELKQNAYDSMTQFMKSLKQEIMMTTTTHSNNNNNTISPKHKSQTSKKSSSSVAVACLLFCLDILQDATANIQLCRAALITMFELLKHGSDCRHALFCVPKSLKVFVDAISSKRNGGGEEDGVVTLFQTEALEMLHFLHDAYNRKRNNNDDDDDDDDAFPRLYVAMRYLEERKGILIHTAGTGVSDRRRGGGGGMAKLRHDRDEAIQYGCKMQKRVEKLVYKMNLCFDVLVPRFDFFASGVSSCDDGAIVALFSFLEQEQERKMRGKMTKKLAEDGSSNIVSGEEKLPPASTTEKGKEADADDDDSDDEDEDDDIDWEDGNEEEDIHPVTEEENINFKEKSGDNENNNEINNNDDTASKGYGTNATHKVMTDAQHKNAVEQTLAFMESTGGIVGGEMEINFDTNQEEQECINSTYQTVNNMSKAEQLVASSKETAAIAMAKSTLKKCVDILSFRHMPLLSTWVDALITADGMTTVQQQKDEDGVSSVLKPTPTSLVLLTPSMRTKRRTTLKILMNLKADVSTALSSAGRLGIMPGGGEGKNEVVISDAKNDGASENDNVTHSTMSSTTSHVGTNITAAASSSSCTASTSGGGIIISSGNITPSPPVVQTQDWKKALGLSSNHNDHGSNCGDKKPSLKHRLILQGHGIQVGRKRRKMAPRLQIKYRST